MGDYHAPQWIDFIENCSPQPPMADFFETVHSVHERVLCDSVDENTENVAENPANSQTNIPCINTKAQEDLKIIKSTPVKVISPKHRNKETTVAETTYEQVLNDAMKKLELCKKPLKPSRDKIIQQSDVFKTPNMPLKSSKSVGYQSIPNKHIPYGQNSTPRPIKVSKNTPSKGNNTSGNMKKMISCSLFKEDKDHVRTDTPRKLNNLVNDSKNNKKDDKKYQNENNETHEKNNDKYNEENEEERNEEDVKALQEEQEEQTNNKNNKIECRDQDNVDAKIEKHNQVQSNKRMTVLTWYNRRRSLHKRRSVPTTNQYVSLAEAVSRFQTETPKRFRTKSTKENHTASTTMNMSKLLQNRLKPTIPISPALMSKNRTRAVTVLSREEREKLEMEKIKKNPIKANPIPRSVLQGPRMKVTGLTKKQATANTSSSSVMAQLNKKNFTTNLVQSKNVSQHHEKVTSVAGPKNTVTKVLVTDPTGIIVKSEEITFFGVPKDTGTTKSVTRVMPFSFEARNKDLQMKKEQRLKSLQEASRVKAGFQARPVPNFSKPQTQSVKQQQITKKPILPCPFSFEERDKKLSKRKERFVKQVLEEDKRGRIFRANPAPVFKPVMVRGISREHLLIKEKSVKMVNEHTDKECENQENREPNVDFSKTKNMQKTCSASCIIDKAPLTEKQEENVKALPIELNTDKRAKERREFDEKIKRREMEEDTKREEEKRKQLEHEKQIKAELRKLTEVKARPMPIYKPLVIDKATKQLTNPQSPAFASKLKMKQI